MEELGLKNVTLDDHCYLMGTLPANTGEKLPSIGFISHMDTSPDYSGRDVKPQIWENYDGGDIALPDGTVIRTSEFPEIKQYKGKTIITSDGSTLLGADDKAGVAEIITVSPCRICNLRCSLLAMRVRPLIGSPWLPVVSTTISSSS